MVGRRGRSERRKKEEEGIKYPVTPSKTPSNYWAILLFLPAFRQDHPVAGGGGEKIHRTHPPSLPCHRAVYFLPLSHSFFALQTFFSGENLRNETGDGRNSNDRGSLHTLFWEGGLTCLFFSLSPPQPRSVYIEEGETGWLMSKA